MEEDLPRSLNVGLEEIKKLLVVMALHRSPQKMMKRFLKNTIYMIRLKETCGDKKMEMISKMEQVRETPCMPIQMTKTTSALSTAMVNNSRWGFCNATTCVKNY